MITTEIDSDLERDRNTNASVHTLENDQDFSMQSIPHCFTLIWRVYPLRRDVTMNWFGDDSTRSSSH
jgi:hypothetical protein